MENFYQVYDTKIAFNILIHLLNSLQASSQTESPDQTGAQKSRKVAQTTERGIRSSHKMALGTLLGLLGLMAAMEVAWAVDLASSGVPLAPAAARSQRGHVS
jgi:hypothetical protein